MEEFDSEGNQVSVSSQTISEDVVTTIESDAQSSEDVNENNDTANGNNNNPSPSTNENDDHPAPATGVLFSGHVSEHSYTGSKMFGILNALLTGSSDNVYTWTEATGVCMRTLHLYDRDGRLVYTYAEAQTNA